jgi:hypothetical protein
VNLILIYQGPDACRRCLGWKRIANDDEQASWKHWAELPPPSNIAVQLGMVFPIGCPRCQGTGKEPTLAARQSRLNQALAGLQAAWDGLSRCVDEFTPDDASACGEYRDALDTAILAVTAAWKEST